MSSVERRLTTILATDCVGYSELMSKDEVKTLENIKSCRIIIESTINEYGGRVFNTAGDSVIAEFISPVDCVNAAIDFQNLLFDRNMNSTDNLDMNFRVGIHLDDVIIEDDDIFGNGVNIAARLESVCDPGEILISSNVHQYISEKINLISEHIGNKKLKNIDDDYSVFRINTGRKKLIDAKEDSVLHQPEYKKLRLLVLPFRNSNKSQDNADIVDGIVEDLITEFSLIKDIEVMSNSTTASIKHDEMDLNDLSDRFGADFLLTGSIRSSGSRVRISVELLECQNGSILWRERYDRKIEDLFDVQDEIVKSVVFPLVGEIELNTLNRAERKPTENLSSYEFLLRGKVLHHKYKKETHAVALDYFNKAIELDPNNGAAYAWRACTVGGGLSRGFFEETETLSRQSTLENINKALEINQNDFECYRMLCRVHLTVYGDHEKAIEFGKKAISLNPNDPRILWAYGSALALSGNGEKALEFLMKSFDLSPNLGVEGSIDNTIAAIIIAFYVIDDHQNVITWFKNLEVQDIRSIIIYLYSSNRLGEKTEKFQGLIEKVRCVDTKKEIQLFKFKDKTLADNLESVISKILL